MSLPDLPTRLQHEVADRVHPPGFDEVLARASAARRRRRTTIGAGLAATLAVGGLAFAAGDPASSDGRSGEPAGPTPMQPWDGTSQVDPRLPADVREVLAESLHPWEVSASDGAVAAVWRSCDEGVDCRFVLTTRAGDDVWGTVLEGGVPPQIAPVPGGWLLEDEDGFAHITPEGEREPLYGPEGNEVDVEVGDTAMETSRGWALLRGVKLLPMPSGAEPVHSAYVTPAGRLLVARPNSEDTIATTDYPIAWGTRRDWGRPVRAATAVVAGHGDLVAVVFLGDAPDGSIPVIDVHISDDAGATWTGTSIPAGLRNLSSVTVSPSGTAYLTTESHGLVRIAPNGDSTVQRLSSHDTSLVTTEDGVCLVAEAGRVDHLQCSDDDGATWSPQPLPGFR